MLTLTLTLALTLALTLTLTPTRPGTDHPYDGIDRPVRADIAHTLTLTLTLTLDP